MTLVIIIDLLVVAILCSIAFSKGVEAALPFATFVLIFVPMESRISLGVFELTTQRLVIVLLFLLYFTLGGNKEQNGSNVSTPLLYLMLVHIAWCILSTIDSIVLIMSIKKLLSVVFEYYLLYFIYWRSISRVQTIHKILMAIVVAILVCSIFGTYEAYRGWNLSSLMGSSALSRFSGIGAESERGNRIHATFGHAILYGTALAMAIVIALFLLGQARKHRTKALLWAGLMLMFLNIYKTSSRGPWLDVILGLLLFSIFGRNQLRRYVLVIVALSITVCIVRPGVWESVEGIYFNTMDTNTTQGSSYEYRYALMRVGTEAVLRSPTRAIWGYGLESFYDLGLVADFLNMHYEFLSCDSSWVELMVETGFVGLFIIALLLMQPMLLAWKRFRSMGDSERNLMLVLFINMFVFYFQMLSVGMYSWGQNGYMLWILIAATYSLDRIKKAEILREDPAPAATGLAWVPRAVTSC
jgi:hypothetical protein